MGETEAQVNNLFDEMVKRFEAQTALIEKKFEDQRTFNDEIALEVAQLGRRVAADLHGKATQVEDDLLSQGEAPSRTEELASPRPRSQGDPPVRPAVYPVLTNNGPPILDPRPSRTIHGEPTAPPHQRTLRGEPSDPSPPSVEPAGYTKPPKHDFPRFNGELPRLWIDRCRTYFDMYRTPMHNWVGTASLYMDGHAALWLHAYRQRHQITGWAQFCRELEEEFGQDEYDIQMGRLMQLRQTGTVVEYRKTFESAMYHLMTLAVGLDTKFFVTQFVLGLRDDIRAVVRIQAPASIARASALARIQEEELDGMPRRVPVRQHQPRVVQAQQPAPVVPAPRADWPKRAATDDYSRERQLRDFRRANGLCFRCGDTYSREHQCKKPAALMTIELGEYGEVFSDDTVHAMELLEENPEAQCCMLSANALSGVDAPDTIRLRALVGNRVMLLLLDSGSTHSFVSTTFAEGLKNAIQPMDAVNVRVANGQQLQCDSWVPKLQWWMQGHTFEADMRVLDIGAYDGVLGMDWLRTHNPMQCDWVQRTISFDHHGTSVTLQGVLPASGELLPLSLEQLHKSQAGNDIWAYAIVDCRPDEPVITVDFDVPPTVKPLLTEFSDVFAEPNTLPPHRVYDHAIPVDPTAPPVNARPYRYSPQQKDEIERQVREMLAAGTITPSMSPYASPVLLVKKKDGSWRFCVDYRRLNTVTIKNKFPLPIVDELLDELVGTKFFSKLDLRAGYHQIRMLETDEPKTASKTHHGHFQFRVMPFGLCNAPATFQCLMNSVFADYIRKFVIIFLDDILVYSKTMDEHLEHLRIVMSLLRQNQLYAKLSKCSFACTSIDYLGHVISSDGVATDPDKTSAMEQWPLPKTVTELHAFLGLTGYYRKFVKNYGIIAKPLTTLLTKKGFLWTEAATTAFNKLKLAMVSTPVLALPDFTQPFQVETDACDTGIGAILSQNGHPIAFLSKALGSKNSQLSVYEKEFLAVMLAVTKWRPYLQRGHFTILTDHKSLCSLQEQTLETDVQRKAMAKLGGLHFSFKYKRGLDNGAADALSRVGQHMECAAISTCQPDWLQEVANSYSTDVDAQARLTRLALHSPDAQGFSLQDGVIRLHNRLWIGNNSALHTKLISAMHASPVGGHSGILATYQRVKHLFAWAGMKRAVEDFVHQCQICQQAKHENSRPAGTLQPLKPPEGAWEEVTMDFIEGLPKSNGFDVILVVVDRLTKYTHFIPLKHPYTAARVADAFMDNIVKLHGAPKVIISDRDRVFTSALWRALFRAIGTKLHYSTAYHPQTDGQTERVNQGLEMYLRCAVHDCPKKWRAWLPMAEFWYNSSHHSAIDCSPFKALYRVEPNFGALPNLVSVDDPEAAVLLQDRQAYNDLLRAQLLKAQHRMKSYADRSRSERQFQEGDSVLLKLQPYAQTSVVNRPFPKLAFKFFGPFTVLKRIGEVAYKLDLPATSSVHPVFHVSQLKPFTPNYSPVFSELPATGDLSTGELLPTEILERRMVKKGSKAIVQIKVQWSSLPPEAATWEDFDVLKCRFPQAPIWEGSATQGEANVTPPSPGNVTARSSDIK